MGTLKCHGYRMHFPMNRKLVTWQFLLFLTLCLFAAYPLVFLGQRTFVFRDFGLYGYPVAHFFRESFHRGEIPLWIPLSSTGMPFLAQWSTLVLYPGSLFYLLLPLSWALGAFCLIHLIIAGWGMYRLAYRWTKHDVASALAGLVFACNGFSMNCLMWTNYVVVMAWMPWALLMADLAWRRGGQYVVWAGLVLGLQFMGGVPELIMFTWLLVAVFWLHDLCNLGGQRLVMILRATGMYLLALGLSLAQLLPFLQFFSQCERSTSFADGTWSLPGTGWANFLVPLFNCFQIVQGVCFQVDQSMTSSYYLGVGVFVLAILSPWIVRSSRSRLLGLILLGGLVMALGPNAVLYQWIRSVFPPLGWIRYPFKFLIPSLFVIPLLAALAIAALDGGPARFRRIGALILWSVLVTGGLILVVVWCGLSAPDPMVKTSLLVPNALMRAVFLLLFMASLLWFFRRERMGVSLWAGWVLLAITAADLLTHTPMQNPLVPRWAYQPNYFRQRCFTNQTPERIMIILSTNKTNQGWLADPIQNFLRNRQAMYDNCNLLDSVPKLGGFYSIYLRQPWELILALYDQPKPEKLPLADFLSVTHYSKPDDPVRWWPRTNYLPLVTCGQAPEYKPKEAIMSRLVSPAFDPRHEVLFEPSLASRISTRAGCPTCTISNLSRSSHQIDFDVQADTSVIAVIAEAFYPSWRAWVDGKPTRLLQANYAYQAVELPSGRHTVELQYVDTAFRLGIAVSLTCIIAGLICVRRAPAG
jgi:hypothetical protein